MFVQSRFVTPLGRALLIVLASIFMICGVRSAAAQDAKSEYRLGTGDRLKLTVFQEDTLTGEYQVDGNGFLTIALIGEVKAAGLTIRELTERLRAGLSEYLRNPKISLEVVNYRPFDIFGEVRNAGRYPYVSNLTIMGAVALAGGFSYRANETTATIRRDGREFDAPLDEATPILPGDSIVIRERFF